MNKKRGAFSNSYLAHSRTHSSHFKSQHTLSCQLKQNVLNSSNNAQYRNTSQEQLFNIGSIEISHSTYKQNRFQHSNQNIKTAASEQLFLTNKSNSKQKVRVDYSQVKMRKRDHIRQQNHLVIAQMTTPNKSIHRKSIESRSPANPSQINKSCLKSKHKETDSKIAAEQTSLQATPIDKDLINKLECELRQLRQRLEQNENRYQRRVLQYEEYTRELSEKVQKLKKYEDGVKFTIMWLLQFYCNLSNNKIPRENFQCEKNKYFMKAFRHLNQHLEELDIQSKLKVLGQDQNLKLTAQNNSNAGLQNENSSELEDTFNFLFRKGILSQKQKQQSKKLQQYQIHDISKKLFDNSMLEEQNQESERLARMGIQLTERQNELSDGNQHLISDLEYSLTQDLNQDSLHAMVQYSSVTTDPFVKTKSRQYQNQNTFDESNHLSQTNEPAQSLMAIVIQDFETDDQNCISPLIRGESITLVKRIDQALWIGETVQKIGYIQAKYIRIQPRQ